MLKVKNILSSVLMYLDSSVRQLPVLVGDVW